MREIPYQQMVPQVLEQLPQGAFLTVQAGDKINTMTIGWGSIGYSWRRPVFCVLVRYSRYTYELIEKAADFSVSIPLSKDWQKALGIAGSKSGRDIDKFAECGIKTNSGIKIQSPHIAECDVVYECQIIHKQTNETGWFDPQVVESCYPQGDYHVMYYGEILGCYCL